MPRDIHTVQLVGAGPGPADLLTVRALRAIEGAQALLYEPSSAPRSSRSRRNAAFASRPENARARPA